MRIVIKMLAVKAHSYSLMKNKNDKRVSDFGKLKNTPPGKLPGGVFYAKKII